MTAKERVSKIAAHAKATRGKNEVWTDAIKRATKELKAKKKI